ncbi:MAG: AAA family ATPase, partial [Proteobacteria bacterium]|nr:AAA family ATPase [Pseudomonadota bacterium]NIS70282.1 AAA family ATPase [Pseudomonadota bacterium]
MKVAISGKGGVGKTTLAGVMARLLADEGKKVLAIDADMDANLASALGIPAEELSGLVPLAQRTDLVEERTASKKGTFGGMFKLNPRVDDIPEQYSVTYKGVKLLVLGGVLSGGSGCFCPENVLLKNLMSHLFVARDETVIVDLEAGLEHLSRGSTGYVDALAVVVEPGLRSFGTARQIKRLANELGITKIYIVGNKITSDEDRQIIDENLNKEFRILGYLSFSPKVIEADRLGASPYDLD